LAGNSNVQELLDDPSNETLKASVLSYFQFEIALRKQEFFTLVDVNRTILSSANANRSGEIFDPSGIVSDVLTNNRRLIVTVNMTNAEFRKEGAARYL
jgi:hypothetical protein